MSSENDDVKLSDQVAVRCQVGGSSVPVLSRDPEVRALIIHWLLFGCYGGVSIATKQQPMSALSSGSSESTGAPLPLTKQPSVNLLSTKFRTDDRSRASLWILTVITIRYKRDIVMHASAVHRAYVLISGRPTSIYSILNYFNPRPCTPDFIPRIRGGGG